MSSPGASGPVNACTPRPPPRRLNVHSIGATGTGANTATRADSVVVKVAGEIDLATIDGLRARLAAATRQARLVTVDLSRVEFMGACALSAFVRVDCELRGRGGGLSLIAAPAPARRLVTICGLDHLLADEPRPVACS